MGSAQRGSLGGSVRSFPTTWCTIVFAKRESRFNRFRSIKRVRPVNANSRLRSSSTNFKASSRSAAVSALLSTILLLRNLLTSSIALPMLPCLASHSAATRYISEVVIPMFCSNQGRHKGFSNCVLFMLSLKNNSLRISFFVKCCIKSSLPKVSSLSA